MKFAEICVLFLCAATFGEVSAGKSGDRTITKVVKLLQEMLEKSKADGATDRELYGKFKCYCDDNEEEKKHSIEESKKEIALLESKISELLGSSGSLSSECAELKSAMAENEAGRKEATSLREKEHETFVKDEEDMKTALDQMDQAIEVLSEIGGDQTLASGAEHEQFMAGQGELAQLKSHVRTALMAASALVTKKQRRTLEAFIQAPTYSSMSGEVVGILKSMKETFESNLEAAITAEKAAAEAYEKFMKAKEEAFETMKASYDEKQEKLGTNDDDLSSKREQLAEAKETLADDEEFLAKLLVMCEEKAKEYEARKLMRVNEEAAISEAIAVLNSDAAFESFGKVAATKTGSTGPTLLQLGSMWRHNAATSDSHVREQVLELLRSVSGRPRSLRLGKIAMLLKAGNPFTKVLDEIDKILALLEEEGAADAEKHDWCNKERETNDADLEEAKSQISTLEGEIQDLDVAINDPETGLLVQIADTETKIETNHKSQEEETKARAEENMAYQKAIANTVEAETILKKAIDILKRHYKYLEEEAETEAEASALVQEDPEGPSTWESEEDSPKGFKGQSEQGTKVIEMLEFILEEVNKEEMAAHTDEQEAQHTFEDSMAELKGELESLQSSLIELKETLAEKEGLLVEKKAELEKVTEVKENIEAYLESIAVGCDWISKHLEERNMARESEKAALEQAVELIKDTSAYKAAVAKEAGAPAAA